MNNFFLSLTLSIFFIVTSCGERNEEAVIVSVSEEIPKGKSLTLSELERYTTLDPLQVLDVVSFHVTQQLFESLLRFDEDNLSLQPSLATSWEVDKTKLVYVFKLRKGVFFHENNCFGASGSRELKGGDVLYSFKRIYTKSKNNAAYALFRGKIDGGEAFYKDTITSFHKKKLEGVKLLDDYTVQITLNQPDASFLNSIATVAASIVAEEAIVNGDVVGTGPFVYRKDSDLEVQIELFKNHNYYLKDNESQQLPYLSSVVFKYIKSTQKQLDLFLLGELDVIVNLPAKGVKEIVNNQIADFQDKPVKYVLGSYPEMATSFININNTKPPFDNKKVRQAIAMALDKNKIIDEVLKGEAFNTANNGVVPPAITHYDYSSVVGLEFDIVKAKELLSEVGYPNGEGFPVVTLASGRSNNNLRTALNIQKQLLVNLNIDVEIESFSIAEVLAKESKGETEMVLIAWLAEFPDPISFLSLFNGNKSKEDVISLNRSGYNNDTYNRLYKKALIAKDRRTKYELCLQLDQIIANDVPVIPLWYHENFRLFQAYIKNYQANTMDIHYLVNVSVD